jgi:hypothetical protein
MRLVPLPLRDILPGERDGERDPFAGGLLGLDTDLARGVPGGRTAAIVDGVDVGVEDDDDDDEVSLERDGASGAEVTRASDTPGEGIGIDVVAEAELTRALV